MRNMNDKFRLCCVLFLFICLNLLVFCISLVMRIFTIIRYTGVISEPAVYKYLDYNVRV